MLAIDDAGIVEAAHRIREWGIMLDGRRWRFGCKHLGELLTNADPRVALVVQSMRPRTRTRPNPARLRNARPASPGASWDVRRRLRAVGPCYTSEAPQPADGCGHADRALLMRIAASKDRQTCERHLSVMRWVVLMTTDPAPGALYAYLDTNTVLEFTPPSDNDWCKLLGANDVVLVITHILIKELESKKDGGDRGVPLRKRKRAGALLKQFEKSFFPNEREGAVEVHLRTGVRMIYSPEPIPEEMFTTNGLDQKVRDAHFVAAALLRHNAGGRVCIVANEYGLRMMARGFKLRVFDMNEEWRLREPPEPDELERRDLKEQLDALKAQIPRLSLSRDGDNRLTFTLHEPRVPVGVYVEREMEAQELYHRRGKGKFDLITATNSALGIRPSSGEFARYDREAEEYLDSAREVMPRIIEFANRSNLFVPLDSLTVHNAGTAPAMNVRIVLRVPPGLMLLAEAPKSQPYLPSPPKAPRDEFESMFSMSSIAPLVLEPLDFSGFPGSAEEAWEVDDNEAEITIGDLRHSCSADLPAIYIQLREYSSAGSFSFEYELHAFNLPKPAQATFNVIVEKVPRLSTLQLHPPDPDAEETD